MKIKIAIFWSICLLRLGFSLATKNSRSIIFGCKEEIILMRSLFYGAMWGTIEELKRRSEGLLDAFFCRIIPTLSATQSDKLHTLIIREQSFYKEHFRLLLKALWKNFFLLHWHVHSSVFLQRCMLGMFSVDGTLGDLEDLEGDLQDAEQLAYLLNQYGLFFLYLETLQQMILEEKELVAKNVRAVKGNLPRFYAKYVSYYQRKLKRLCVKAASLSGSVIIFD
jgi:hypothetical protein